MRTPGWKLRLRRSPDHPDGEGGFPGPLHHIGDAVDEPALGIGEPEHLLGADLHRPLPHEGIVRVPADDQHPAPARSPAHPACGVVPDEHERRGLPADAPARRHRHAVTARLHRHAGTPRAAPAASVTTASALLGHRMVHMRLGARGRAQPQQIVEQEGVLGDDQRPSTDEPGPARSAQWPDSACFHALRHFTRLRSSHDLRPLLTANPAAADFAAGITVQRSGKGSGSCPKTVDNTSPVNNSVTPTGEFQSAAEQLHSVTSLKG